MIQSLKPCPYCGATPFEEIRTEIKANWFDSYSAYFTVFIGCKRCEIEMNSGKESAKRITFDKLDEIREGMRKRWNKRTETFLTITNSDSRLET